MLKIVVNGEETRRIKNTKSQSIATLLIQLMHLCAVGEHIFVL
jgi:hypothetical protein